MKAESHILTATEVSKKRIRYHRGFSVGHIRSWAWSHIRTCLAGRRAKVRWKSGLRTAKNDTEQQRQ